jgi:hypothetical protein
MAYGPTGWLSTNGGTHTSGPLPAPRAIDRYRQWKGPDGPIRHIYFIRAATGHIKIGTALNPTTRLADLQVGNPQPLELIGAVPGSRAQEKALHAEFAEHRSIREWFNPTPALLERIQQMLG